jgi:hypothetical protein
MEPDRHTKERLLLPGDLTSHIQIPLSLSQINSDFKESMKLKVLELSPSQKVN